MPSWLMRIVFNVAAPLPHKPRAILTCSSCALIASSQTARRSPKLVEHSSKFMPLISLIIKLSFVVCAGFGFVIYALTSYSEIYNNASKDIYRKLKNRSDNTVYTCNTERCHQGTHDPFPETSIFFYRHDKPVFGFIIIPKK